MKIIIPNADFSGISIGTTTVPYIPISETLAYTNAIPNTFATLTENKKKALNKFFKTLKANDLLGGSKIAKMYLPKFGRVDGGVNLVTPSENIGFPATNATYTSNGVQFSVGWKSGISIATYNNTSFGFFNTTARPLAEGDNNSYGIGVNANGFFLGRRTSSGNLAGLLLNSSLLRPQVLNRSFSTGLVQCRIALNSQAVMIDGEYAEITQNYTVAPLTSTLIFSSHTEGSVTGLLNASVGFYYVSNSALTQVEMSILNSAINTLFLTI